MEKVGAKGRESSQRQAARVTDDFYPKFDWIHNPESHILLVQLPGFKKEELKVQLDEFGNVTVSGERQVSVNRRSRFKQAFPLPDDSNFQMVNGKFDNGTLYIIVPKMVSSEGEKKESTKEEKKTSKGEHKETIEEEESTSHGDDGKREEEGRERTGWKEEKIEERREEKIEERKEEKSEEGREGKEGPKEGREKKSGEEEKGEEGRESIEGKEGGEMKSGKEEKGKKGKKEKEEGEKKSGKDEKSEESRERKEREGGEEEKNEVRREKIEGRDGGGRKSGKDEKGEDERETKSWKGKVAAGRERIEKGDLGREIREKIGVGRERIEKGELGREIRDKIGDTVGKCGEWKGNIGRKLGFLEDGFAGNAWESIRKNKHVIISAAVGLTVGLLITRKLRSRRG